MIIFSVHHVAGQLRIEDSSINSNDEVADNERSDKQNDDIFGGFGMNQEQIMNVATLGTSFVQSMMGDENR